LTINEKKKKDGRDGEEEYVEVTSRDFYALLIASFPTSITSSFLALSIINCVQ